MAGKFIPDGDREFAFMARDFAMGIEKDPGRYNLSADDAAIISRCVQAYRDALAASLRRRFRTTAIIARKDVARAEAEAVIRRYANPIRADASISTVDKELIGVRVRPTRLRRRRCPQDQPYLRYLGSGGGVHTLEFREAWGASSRAKPANAARLELFAMVLPVGAKAPYEPRVWPWAGGAAADGSGLAVYMGSFTTNPIRVKHPMPPAPMQVVYWARWADAKGNVGPWSECCIARIEGGAREGVCAA